MPLNLHDEEIFTSKRKASEKMSGRRKQIEWATSESHEEQKENDSHKHESDDNLWAKLFWALISRHSHVIQFPWRKLSPLLPFMLFSVRRIIFSRLHSPLSSPHTLGLRPARSSSKNNRETRRAATKNALKCNLIQQQRKTEKLNLSSTFLPFSDRMNKRSKKKTTGGWGRKFKF